MKRLLKSRAVDQALRGAALVVTDRRWAPPLSAAALGFGIFAGVAIGPGAGSTLATGAQQIVALPAPAAGEGEGGATVTASAAGPLGEGGGGRGGALGGGALEASVPPALPLASEASEAPLLPAETAPEAPPQQTPPAGEEEEAEGEALEGVVVHANPAAGSYSLAISGGELVAVHASKLPAPGTRLELPVRRLANGTFAEDGARASAGKAARASFNGTVTYVDPTPAAPAYTVSGRGASVLVRVAPDPSGALPPLPALGSYATVTATIEGAPTILQQVELEVDDAPSTYLEMAGIVKALLPETGQLLFSADDAGESGKDLTLKVPASIDTSKLQLGASFLATATIEADASLALAGLVSDERAKGADDPQTAQGDLQR